MLEDDPRSLRTTEADYTTDYYPIDGCELRVTVDENGFMLSVFGPGGQWLESYSHKATLPELLQLVERWALGRTGEVRHEEYQSCVML